MMISFFRTFVAVALFFGCALATAAEVAGVKLDDRIQLDGTTLVLNGAGVRTRIIFKVYVGALYVPQQVHVAAQVIDATAPRRMQLSMLRDVEADTLLNALREGLRANTGADEYATLAAPLTKLEGLFRSVGHVREGDVLTLDFSTQGVALGMNGEARGKVEGESFGRALLKVWLGEHPVQASLKKDLLAQ